MPPAHSDIFASAPVRQEKPYQPSPFDGILEKCRDLICERLDEAVALMLDSAHEIITQLIKDTQIREEWRLYEEARKVATEQRETIEKYFRSAYRADFQRRSDRARKIGKPFDKLDCSFEELELIGEDDYDETLKFNDMAHKLRNYCEEELSALDQRVGVLLGDAGLAAKDNPFSPEVVCDAFKLACRQLDCDAQVRRVFLKLFDDQVLDEIRSVYKAVNGLLVRSSILPQIRYSISRSGDGGGGHARGGSAAQLAEDFSVPNAGPGAAQDLFSMLQTLVANSAAAARMPAAPAPAPAGFGMAATAANAVAASAPAMAAGVAMPAGGIPVAPGAVGTTQAPGGAVTAAAPAFVPAGAVVVPGNDAACTGETPVLNAGVMPVGAAAPALGGVVVLQGTELLSALTRIQLGETSPIAGASDEESESEDAQATQAPVGPIGLTNVLHQLKTSNVGAGMNPLDRMTLDIIAMLFDELFDDPKVPSTIKGLIGRLQIPMLKVAISDKTFFSTKSHPARRLLDAVGEVALRLPADFDDTNPLFARIEAVVQQLVEGYQEDLEIFTQARDELLELMAEEDRRIEQEALAQAKQVEEMENLALARNAAQQEVLARIRVRELPPAVLKFIAQEWIKLLLVIHAKEGVESEAWKDAVAAMDDLIWSVEPKSTPEDRRKLAALIPGLIKRLTAGIENAGMADAVRSRFFSELMTYHMQAISSTPRAAPETAAEAKPEAAAEAAAASAPADAVQPVESETVTQAVAADGTAAPPEPAPANAESLDFTAPITVQNPFGGGEVAVDNLDLDFTAEAIAGAKAKREASIRRALDNLKMGHWVEFRDPDNEGKTKPGRLIFVSPKKTRYLFATDRAGKEIIQCSRAEIGRRFLMGQAVKLDEPPEESLFDRIMGGLLGKLRMSGRTALFAQ